MLKKQGLPIISVFRGDRYYLPHCFAQARASNPDSEFILLGDNSTKYYRGISHHKMQDYYQSAQRLQDSYTHIHTSAGRFQEERFCLLRWLILNEFMKKQGLEQCFVMDADVLLYQNLEKVRQYYEPCELTLVGDIASGCLSGGSSFLFKRDILDKLEGIIIEIYSDTKLNKELAQFVTQGALVGVSDMVALTILYQRFPNKIKNAFAPAGGYIIQAAITNDTQSIEMENECQKIYWHQDVPWGQLLETPQKVKFILLHCNGNILKKKMWRYVKLHRFSEKWLWWLNILQYKLYKYPKRFLNKLLGRKLFPKL